MTSAKIGPAVSPLVAVQGVLVAIGLLLVGHGLQLTLLPLRAQSLGWDAAAVGLTGSAYFGGFIAGCLLVPRLVRRAGHIRVFTGLVALAVFALVAATLWAYLPVWLVARALTGLCFAGIYMVVESWLNEQAPNESRGQVLSAYLVITMAAMAIGQLLAAGGAVDGERLVLVAVGLLAVAIVPVALTRAVAPAPPSDVHLSLATIREISRTAMFCVLCSGLASGMVWSLGAVTVSRMLDAPDAGAHFVMAFLLGGLLFQYPAGRWSDRLDRRLVLLALAIIGAIAATTGVLYSTRDSTWTGAPGMLPAIGFLIGAAAVPMYAIGVAHANDRGHGQFLTMASALLMANSIGAIAGPIVVSGLGVLQIGTVDSVFGAIAAAFLAAALWTSWRLMVRSSPPHRQPFEALPRTSPEAALLIHPAAPTTASEPPAPRNNPA